MPVSHQSCVLLKCCGQRAQCSDHTAAGTDTNKRHKQARPLQRAQTQKKRREERYRDMTLPTVRQLFCLFWCFGCWSMTDGSLLDQWEDGIALRKIRGIQSDDLSDVLWRDQNENQVQNVFKRFLFHYSKALNSVGAVQHQANSVHPLMRLSPKLSQRRKKVVLLKIRSLPEGML